MPDVRLSPSGPNIPVELETNAVENQSLVPGDNVTESLDYLYTANQWRLFEEFLGGTSATLVASQDGGIGELGWSFVTTGGQLARPASGDYIGAYEITANATLISGIRPGPNGGGSSPVFPVSTITLCEWLATPTLITTGAFRVGLGVNLEMAQFGGNSLYFEASPASPFWRFVSRRSAATVTVTSTIPWVSGAPVSSFMLTRNSSSGLWTASIDGVVIGTMVANSAPIVTLNGMAQVVGGAAAVQSAVVDSFRLNYDR